MASSLPSASFGIAGQHCTFILAGPGVKEGGRLRGQVRAVDVAPTLCYLLGMPMPRNVEGGVVYEGTDQSRLAFSQRPWFVKTSESDWWRVTAFHSPLVPGDLRLSLSQAFSNRPRRLRPQQRGF